MELSYWKSRWRKKKVGFHMPGGYPGLIKHWASLKIPPSATVIVPFCGKSRDLIHLSKHCARVIGVEISEVAIHEFLTDNNLHAEHSSYKGFKIFKTGNMELWCGDFLKLPVQKIPVPDLIYDKAALVALPPEKRGAYAEKVLALSIPETRILLHHFIYNQDEMPGPPFSVTKEEIRILFGKNIDPVILEEQYLDLDHFKKFRNRGLKSGFKERFLIFTPGNW